MTGTDADIQAIQISTPAGVHFFETHQPTGVQRGRDRADSHACSKCGAPLEPVLFTSWGCELWSERPMVMDGWRCSGCDSMSAPAFLTIEQVKAIQHSGVEAARAGDMDVAEFHFRRIASSWTGYGLASMNLASVYEERLKQDHDPAHTERYKSIVETEMRIAANADPVPAAFVHSTLARIYAHRQEVDAAREQIAAVRAFPGCPQDELDTVDHIEEWMEGGWWRYEEGNDLIRPHIWLDGRERVPLLGEGRAELERGAELLESFAADHPEHWQSMFFAGKAREALEDADGCLRWFEAAHALGPDNPNVAREYGSKMLELGQADKAVELARSAIEVRPNDPELIGNLAVSLVCAGDMAEARRRIEEALALDRNDTVNLAVRRLIEDVESGKRERPTRLLPGGQL